MISMVLWVADIEQNIAFYTEKMGLTSTGNGLPGPDGKLSFTDIAWGDTMLFLQKVPNATPQPPNFDIYVKLDDNADIDSIYNTMRTHGVQMHHEIKDEFWGERSFGVTDMNGFQWRVATTVRDVSMEEMSEHSAKGES